MPLLYQMFCLCHWIINNNPSDLRIRRHWPTHGLWVDHICRDVSGRSSTQVGLSCTTLLCRPCQTTHNHVRFMQHDNSLVRIYSKHIPSTRNWLAWLLPTSNRHGWHSAQHNSCHANVWTVWSCKRTLENPLVHLDPAWSSNKART
jgi:hypothetical protein